ncbi:hypothetical protein BJ878DRAFT_62515 [Calycina marina]|uniref:O-methyltransferase C-terminal domain-containing protein n=1 Tax=Calycina marina TaxID=1763456 RepID=A0A9P7Z9Y2_9HELO|nr:hypothetical protein BJ878DRAFT_62515 [Calycina marina]
MFTPQPIHGSGVYFYHHILHDWADEYCLRILASLKPFMTPGYSKFMLYGMIVPERGASTFFAQLDITMMAFNGGMEHMGKQWTGLSMEAGFDEKGIKLWQALDDGAGGIFEAMVLV